MSVENEKVCCNCRHCIRRRDKKYDMIVCRCEKYDKYLSYAEVMCGWCKHWSKEIYRYTVAIIDNDVQAIADLPSAQPEYKPVTAENFAKTLSENTLYGFMPWHGEAFTLIKEIGFEICKKDDVIYRQEAIDALCRRCDLVAEDDEPCTEKCNDIKILEKLLFAQQEIIRCKDCIYWWESHKMCKRNKDKNHNCACMDCDADFYCKYAERRTDE